MLSMIVATAATMAASFNLSNTLGDGMVLQRAPQHAVVWGFGLAMTNITTVRAGHPKVRPQLGGD